MDEFEWSFLSAGWVAAFKWCSKERSCLFYACNCSASFAFEAGLHDHGSDRCGSDDDAFNHDKFAHLFAAEFAELLFSEELGDADGDFFHFFGVFLVFYAELRVGSVVGVLEEVVRFFEEFFCEGLVIGEEFFEVDCGWNSFPVSAIWRMRLRYFCFLKKSRKRSCGSTVSCLVVKLLFAFFALKDAVSPVCDYFF